MRKLLLLTTYYLLLTTLLCGCATIAKGPPAPPYGTTGIYHQVEKGESLWRISRVYGVGLEEIARINRLADSSRIYAGQLIFIPGAKEVIEDLVLQADVQSQGGDFIWPMKGKVSSFYGMKKDKIKNKGICIQAWKGASVVSSRAGKIAFCSDNLKGYGKIVIIDHRDGYSTVYTHISENLVKLNQPVSQGQLIAKLGSSGRISAPELYFEIRKGHKPQNPFFYLP